jgi:hypothetical protein
LMQNKHLQMVQNRKYNYHMVSTTVGHINSFY